MDDLGRRHESLTQAVQARLHEQILAGVYLPGARLAEGTIARELGVSRMPVREALRGLVAQGLVVVQPRRGAHVAQIEAEHGAELVEVRATLERLNARLAAQRCAPAMAVHLRALLKQGRVVCGDPQRIVELQRLNARAHGLMSEATANALLSDLMRRLRDRTLLMFAPWAQRRAVANWQEHARIIEAVLAGDVELAGLLAERHVRDAAAAYRHMDAPSRAGV